MVRAHPTVPPSTSLKSFRTRSAPKLPRHLCCGAPATRACESGSLHPQFRQILRWGDLSMVFRGRGLRSALILAAALGLSVGPARAQS